jgi:hypothetical protein
MNLTLPLHCLHRVQFALPPGSEYPPWVRFVFDSSACKPGEASSAAAARLAMPAAVTHAFRLAVLASAAAVRAGAANVAAHLAAVARTAAARLAASAAAVRAGAANVAAHLAPFARAAAASAARAITTGSAPIGQ